MNYVKIDESSKKPLPAAVLPNCFAEAEDLYSGIVADKSASPFIPSAYGLSYDNLFCNPAHRSRMRGPAANNFDFYRKPHITTKEGQIITNTIYLRDEIDLSAEDVIDGFGAPLLFDNSSYYVKHPYSPSDVKKLPPFNARIVATIPTVHPDNFTGELLTMHFNKYEYSENKYYPARGLSTIRRYNAVMHVRNRYRGVRFHSCFDPYVEPGIQNHLEAGNGYCVQETGELRRAPYSSYNHGVSHVNFMKYPVKLYIRYVESPY